MPNGAPERSGGIIDLVEGHRIELGDPVDQVAWAAEKERLVPESPEPGQGLIRAQEQIGANRLKRAVELLRRDAVCAQGVELRCDSVDHGAHVGRCCRTVRGHRSHH